MKIRDFTIRVSDPHFIQSEATDERFVSVDFVIATDGREVMYREFILYTDFDSLVEIVAKYAVRNAKEEFARQDQQNKLAGLRKAE